jgi:hypothetical protein
LASDDGQQFKREDLAMSAKKLAIATPDYTGNNRGQWQPGESGNPAGRPKGSRNRISEKFLDAFAKDFDEHGEGVIQTVRTERPHDYLKIAASLLPKRMELEDGLWAKDPREMTDDELEALIWRSHLTAVEAGLEPPLSGEELDQARARRLAKG